MKKGLLISCWCWPVSLYASGVSRVWRAWHVPWAPLWRGRKNWLAKIKNFIYSFL